MGRKSKRSAQGGLPTTIVVPNFELDPSEAENWEGYPEPAAASKPSPRRSRSSASSTAPAMGNPSRRNSAPSPNTTATTTEMRISLPTLDDDDDSGGECDAVPEPLDADKENGSRVGSPRRPSSSTRGGGVAEAQATSGGHEWGQLGKEDALRLVLPNQDPFAAADPFQDPAATSAARRSNARFARARGVAAPATAPTAPPAAPLAHGVTCGHTRALKGAIPFKPSHRLTPPRGSRGADDGDDGDEAATDPFGPPAAPEDPFGSPVKRATADSGALFDAFSMETSTTA